MTESRPPAADYDLKQCGRCAAWIPRTATMCAYCNSSSPDSRIDPRPSVTPLGLPPWVSATRVIIFLNVAYFVFSTWVQMKGAPRTALGPWLLMASTGTRHAIGLEGPGAYMHERVVSDGEWWRTLTCVFLHGGIIHLGVNMWSLWNIGRFAEDLFGTAKFVTVYVISGACSALAISVWFVHVQGMDPAKTPSLVGASGAIFGVGGLLAAFLLRRGTGRGRQIGFSIAQNLGLMLLLGFTMTFVSNTGHVGGLVPGAILGLFVTDRFSTRLSPENRRNWWLLATVATVACLVALGLGISFTLKVLGAPR